MDTLDSEKRRARNLIRNAAGDYSFEPDFRACDEEGRAVLYWNSIIGAACKNYGVETIDALFSIFRGRTDEQTYEVLVWLGWKTQFTSGRLTIVPPCRLCGRTMPAV